MTLDHHLSTTSELYIRQRREMVELLGFETRNKFEVKNADGAIIGFAAEQQKGLLGFMFRQLLGHWRRFEFTVFDEARQPYLRANHPFRFFFQRMDIADANGRMLGALQQRFALFYKSFDVLDATGRVVFRVRSPFWRIWTFPFTQNGRELAVVQKKWSGLLREAFWDADNFRVGFTQADLPLDQRKLILCASLFIDLQYFEKKAD